jgi:uncharacterized protein
MEPTTLILCGASVRAAAQSALRAGFAVWCADLFRDADLAAICPEALRVEDYPHGLPVLLVRHAPSGPCVFTGALENHPEVIAEIGRDRPIWGMSPEILQKIRQPETLQEALAAGGFPSLEVRLTPPARKMESVHWLRKPFASGGGQRICMWDDSPSASNPDDYYWQQYFPGESQSALFLADGQTAMLIGLCRQLIGQSWLHAAPFAYCGNIGPLPMTESERNFLQSLGTFLTARFGLCGLFGLDLIRDGESFFVTEVNPRYTASVELYELAHQVPLLAWHGEVYQSVIEAGPRAPPRPALKDRAKPEKSPLKGADMNGNASPLQGAFSSLARSFRAGRHGTGDPSPCLAKAILYAPNEMMIPGDFLSSYTHRNPVWQLPAYADVPPLGTVIQAGQPVLTLFAAGNDAAGCRSALEKEAYSLDILFRRL